jgi:hypothetical protein
MARKKDMENTPGTILLEVPADSDLPLRIEKISEQTGMPLLDLFQKWVLQEESLLGLMQRGKTQTTKQAETLSPTSSQQIPDVRKQEKAAQIDPNSPEYRKALVKRIQKLKKEGMTLVKIAEIFNKENVLTLSGKGKWYSSSITWLLNSNT